MLTINKTVTMSPEQYEIVIKGMRNPMNSWDRSDSYKTHIEDAEHMETADYAFFMGENDHDLAMRLAKGGSVHAKYRRMMPVWVDITAPLYWWKEFDTYKVGTVTNSCSTMHKIHEKEFTLDDFSHEHLDHLSLELLDAIICKLNANRNEFLEFESADDSINSKKDYWWQMIQLLPTSYNQTRTVMLNYENLVGIYQHRRNHKLDEWHTLCDWIENLPYSELIIGEEEEEVTLFADGKPYITTRSTDSIDEIIKLHETDSSFADEYDFIAKELRRLGIGNIMPIDYLKRVRSLDSLFSVEASPEVMETAKKFAEACNGYPIPYDQLKKLMDKSDETEN